MGVENCNSFLGADRGRELENCRCFLAVDGSGEVEDCTRSLFIGTVEGSKCRTAMALQLLVKGS